MAKEGEGRKIPLLNIASGRSQKGKLNGVTENAESPPKDNLVRKGRLKEEMETKPMEGPGG